MSTFMSLMVLMIMMIASHLPVFRMRIAAAYPASIKNNMTAACSAKNTGFDSLTSMNAKICLWNMYSGIALFIKTYTPYPFICHVLHL